MKDIKPTFLAAVAIFCSQKGVQALPQGIGVQPLPDDNYCDPDPPYQVRNVVEDEKPTEGDWELVTGYSCEAPCSITKQKSWTK